jgi:ribosomal protein S20
VQAAHRDLVRWLDRAVTRGALHKNTASRRKAQAAKLVASD